MLAELFVAGLGAAVDAEQAHGGGEDVGHQQPVGPELEHDGAQQLQLCGRPWGRALPGRPGSLCTIIFEFDFVGVWGMILRTQLVSPAQRASMGPDPAWAPGQPVQIGKAPKLTQATYLRRLL